MRLKVPGVLQRGRADAGRESEVGVVGDGQRFVVVPYPDYRGDRAENLFPIDLHPIVRVGEQGRRQVEAGRVALENFTTDETRTFATANAEIAKIGIELPLIDGRTYIGTRLESVTDVELGHSRLHGADETVVDVVGDNQAAGGRTALTGLKEGALDCAIDGGIEVRIIQHDQRVFAAHLQLQLDHSRNGAACDVTARGDRAGEAQRIHAADDGR